jgi:hypothetical protein
VKAYEDGKPKQAATMLRELSRAYGKRNPKGPGQLANYLTWTLVIEPEPTLRRVLVGAVFLESKKLALAQQATYLRRQTKSRRARRGVTVTLRSFSKNEAHQLDVKETSKRLRLAALQKELGLVEQQLEAVSVANVQIQRALQGASGSGEPGGTDAEAAAALAEALAGLSADEASAEQLMALFMKLQLMGGDTSDAKEQLLLALNAQALQYLALCNQGSQEACDKYYATLEKIADVEAS